MAGLRSVLWTLAAASLLAACAGAPEGSGCADPHLASSEVAGYRLDSGDRIRLTVFRQPDLSGEFALDGEGKLALPLAGEIAAAGLTARQIEDAIEQRFRDEDYLVDPKVAVEVLTYRPFYILGEVGQPGKYEYQNGMTVINAVARAGGYTYRADARRATIVHGDCIIAGGPASSVLPGAIVTVPERFF